MNQEELKQVALQFVPENEIGHIAPLGEGFINDTYVIYPLNPSGKKYLLQRKNKKIFVNIPGMMENIDKVTRHIRRKVVQKGGNPEREVLTVIPSRDGKFYFLDSNEEYWAVCLFIENHLVYEKVDSPEIAYSGGKGIGRFQSLLIDFREELVDTLPGFHNMRFRFEQWDAALQKDLAGRKDSMKTEIGWIEARRGEMLDFWKLVENGTIPKRVTHNDTKISNILFNTDGEVLCMIDLDTMLQSPVLNDFGDAIRSYANIGAEDEKDLSKVAFDMERYKAFTAGYLSETRTILTKPEIDYLAFSARFITFEQVLRFLMDYLNGDTYYRIKYPEHNLVRTHAQYKLLQDMENHFSQMHRKTLELALNE